jgi:hypothetical protein
MAGHRLDGRRDVEREWLLGVGEVPGDDPRVDRESGNVGAALDDPAVHVERVDGVLAPTFAAEELVGVDVGSEIDPQEVEERRVDLPVTVEVEVEVLGCATAWCEAQRGEHNRCGGRRLAERVVPGRHAVGDEEGLQPTLLVVLVSLPANGSPAAGVCGELVARDER